MQEKSQIDYLDALTSNKEAWVHQLEEEARTDHIPIMDRQGIQFLQQLIRLHKPQRILEIGTAIGYSALQMNAVSEQSNIISVERNSDMYKKAQKNIAVQNSEERIELVFGDALDRSEEIIAKGPFDFIFIDAAKGQYKHFFQTFTSVLTKHGCVVTDNVLFKGYVADSKDAPKRLKNLAAKINRYNEWLMEHPSFHTSIFPIGDGIAVSIKKD